MFRRLSRGSRRQSRKATGRWSAAFVALVSLAAAPGVARADDNGGDASSLGGFSLLARANPFQLTYDSPGLLPVDPIIQVSVPEAFTTLASGPTGYSLASLTFPGPLLADLGSAVAQEGPECQPPTPIPSYPLRSEAFFPQGPTDADGSPVPGSRMHAIANGLNTSAMSAWSDLEFPTVFSLGSVSGTSSTSGTGDTAVTTAKSVVHGFSLLGGMVTIDSVTTDLKATSNGNDGATQGTTRVAGAAVAGQPVTIDETGVHPVTDGAKPLTDALAQGGISIKVTSHHENKDGGLAERVADGVVIEIDYNGQTAPVISTLLAAIPTGQLPADNFTGCAPSSPQALVNLFKDVHIESIALGAATVSSNASPAFTLPSLDVSTPLPGATDVSGVSLDAGGGDLGGGSSGASGGALSSATPSAFANTGTEAAGFVGGEAVPAGLVLLALAAFLLAGAYARRFADAALTASGGADCPLGDDD